MYTVVSGLCDFIQFVCESIVSALSRVQNG